MRLIVDAEAMAAVDTVAGQTDPVAAEAGEQDNAAADNKAAVAEGSCLVKDEPAGVAA